MDDPNRDLFACGMINPYEVRWARVMIIYKLLSLDKDFDEDGSKRRKRLGKQYARWLDYNLEREDVEFNLALLILFSVQSDTYMAKLRSMLALPDEEPSGCDGES